MPLHTPTLQAPASLLTGEAYHWYQASHVKSALAALKQNVKKHTGKQFTAHCKRGWDGWQPGMAVRLCLVPAARVPAEVRDAAASG